MELHDSINPNLIAVNMKLEMIRKSKVEDLESESIHIKELLDTTIGEISLITHDLHPIILDSLGFVRAVFNLCSKFRERTRIEYEINSRNIPRHFPPEMEINLYRIVQEALNNVEKHSKATKVLLDFSIENSILSIIIKDNGIGFNKDFSYQRSDPKLSFGLRNMEERIQFFNGDFRINSSRSNGTEVLVTIPYNYMEDSIIE